MDFLLGHSALLESLRLFRGHQRTGRIALNEAIISRHFENGIQIPTQMAYNALRQSILGLDVEESLQLVSRQVAQLAIIEGRNQIRLVTFCSSFIRGVLPFFTALRQEHIHHVFHKVGR
jgi:hypothetical protein